MEPHEKAQQQTPVKKRKWISRTLWAIVLVFAVFQFFQPGKNNQNMDMTNDISTVVTVPADVHAILKTSCYDCHSNFTNYPWYASIQPIGWWLKDHIDEGKSKLNFQEFALVEPRPNSPYNTKELRQDHKLEELVEQVEKGEMPLNSYTIIHRDAILSASQAKLIMDWANAARAQLMAPPPPPEADTDPE
ncbi:MAG TPA: heme-binding domain-containing protein [Phnomibacter sp.]|nr:heme-binding domain-containing protein [Phnomibacter sp.]